MAQKFRQGPEEFFRAFVPLKKSYRNGYRNALVVLIREAIPSVFDCSITLFYIPDGT